MGKGLNEKKKSLMKNDISKTASSSVSKYIEVQVHKIAFCSYKSSFNSQLFVISIASVVMKINEFFLYVNFWTPNALIIYL
jgi:hypothetical protein